MIPWQPVTPAESLPPQGTVCWVLVKGVRFSVILEAVFMKSIEDQEDQDIVPGFGTSSGKFSLDEVAAWCPKEAINLPET